MTGGDGDIRTIEIAARGMRFTADMAGPELGAPVIFLHGFPNSRHSWGGQLRAVAAAGYRGLAYDQRGYSPGARPAGIAAYAVAEIVADVIAIADTLDIRRFHLVGHDWGGQIAWATAIAHPDRLSSLTVLSRPHPAAFARALEGDPRQAERSRHHKAFQDPNMAAQLLADEAKAIRDSLTYERASGAFGIRDGGDLKRRMSDDLADRHLSVVGDLAAMDAALNWYRAAFQGASALALADMPAVRVPTLYLWGEEDSSVGRMAAEGTRACVDAAYIFTPIPGAGHFLAEEVPDQVNAALLAHLAAL